MTVDQKKKPDEPKPLDSEAPISLSNLESNKLEQFGKGDVVFSQNTVPFDFDGEYLLWMAYLPKGVREVYIYDFSMKSKETIMTFSASDGIISHCKLSGRKSALKVTYVKDCKNVVMFDVKSKKSTLVGTTPDAIVALHVSSKKLRSVDIDPITMEENKIDLENEQEYVVISTADDSETISLFDTEKLDSKGKATHSVKIKQASSAPATLKQKDLFGLGYPYFICSYDGHVAVSTDFGICLLSYE